MDIGEGDGYEEVIYLLNEVIVGCFDWGLGCCFGVFVYMSFLIKLSFHALAQVIHYYSIEKLWSQINHKREKLLKRSRLQLHFLRFLSYTLLLYRKAFQKLCSQINHKREKLLKRSKLQ